MNKVLKWVLISILSLVVLAYAGFKFAQYQTKKHSPEARVEFQQNGQTLTVNYCRPYKKDRDIFGGLIPYGEVWRTGANEATTFTSSSDVKVGGKLLPKGQYTLWTIPNDTAWGVIFNTQMYGWGVNFDAKASREKQYDALTVNVPVEYLNDIVDQFTISFEETNRVNMVLEWDDVKVRVPMEIVNP